MTANKYISLTAISNHEQNDCNQSTPRCFCNDTAKIVFSDKRMSGHYVYPQKPLTPPSWGQTTDGCVHREWRQSNAFILWLEDQMREFNDELEYEYNIIGREVIEEFFDADESRDKAFALHDWKL